MKKYFGILLSVFLFIACSSSSNNEEGQVDSLSISKVEEQANLAVSETPALGEWKGIFPLASSNEKGETEEEFSIILKENNLCDFIGFAGDAKDVPYTFEGNKLTVGESVFEYEGGKLYLLNEEGKRFDMGNCYILELAPATTPVK